LPLVPDHSTHDQNAAARLAGLLDSAMDAIITVDEAQNIVMYNRAAERTFGWSAQEVRGRPLDTLLPERFRGSHTAHVRRFGATGITSRRMSGSTVVYGLRKSGDEFPVDASISQLDTPEGKLYTVILRDVTERVRAEGEQARLAARLTGLLDSAMDGIITVDEEQRIVMYNRAAERIFGWPHLQVMGQTLDMLLPPRFRHSHFAHMQRFGATGVTSRRMGADMVIHGMRRSGEEFPMDASISQIDTPEGKLYTVILRDVTERVRAQEDLAAFAKQASAIREQEKSRVARELHDELAQTLTALKMDAIWLKDNLDGPRRQAVAKLEGMLAMLDTAVASTRRIAADLRPLVLDDLGLVPAIEWLVNNFQQRTGIACELRADEESELGEPYATAVFRIVQESLANVAKHAQARRVSVSIAPLEGGLRLKVQDDGIGFDTSATRKPGSLGLAGLRERAQLLGGSVVVHSRPGQGTTIDAYIPLREERAP
jgi:PAS domain S-box-containing protein